MKNSVKCTDYDSMGDFSRFPFVEEKKEKRTIFWYIKKIFFLSSFCLIISCATIKEQNITYLNGACYPTNSYVDEMLKMSKQTGLKYEWFECEWVSKIKADSIRDHRAELVYLKMLEDYSGNQK